MKAPPPTKSFPVETATAVPPPGSEAAAPTPWQLRLQARRRHQLATAHRLIAGGLSRTAAAAEAGIGTVTLWRLERIVEEKGIAGLLPKKSKGVPPLLDPALYTPTLISALQQSVVRCGSIKAGALAFSKDARCPAPLRRYILSRNSLPEKLRRLVALRRCQRTIRYAGPHFFVEGLGLDQQNAA